MKTKMLGHEFLAHLGKKRLRPGGKKGTDYLIKAIKTKFNDCTNLNILEVACNRGYSLLYLHKKIKCNNMYGIDINPKIVEIAKKNIKKEKLDNKIHIYNMNALNMDFKGIKFDVIINEALLTMMPNKVKLLEEYSKHLKDGGIILTHDICNIHDDIKLNNEMSEVINLKPSPLSKQKWFEIFKESKLNIINSSEFPFTLTSPIGMIRDEGFINAINIFRNAHKSENIDDFSNMKNFFKKNKNNLKAICIVSTKN